MRFGVGAPFGQAADIVVILLGCVSADIDIRKLVLAQVWDELSEVVEAMIDEAERPAGEGRVAAGRFLGRDLQHQHRDAVLARAQGRAGRRVSGADNDDVALGDVHFLPPNVSHRRSPRVKPGEGHRSSAPNIIGVAPPLRQQWWESSDRRMVPPFSQRWLAPVELRLGRVLGGVAGGEPLRLAGPAAVGSAAAAGEACSCATTPCSANQRSTQPCRQRRVSSPQAHQRSAVAR